MDILITLLYQPFFNLLIGYYIMLERIPGVVPDIGVAVILLTLTIRVIMLPLSISSTRSKHERHQIEKAIKEAQKKSQTNHQAKNEVRKIFGSNRRILISEGLNFFIQLGIFFILYRIFTTGLKGDDLHLVYDFMPEYNFPFNLNFLGTFDLAQPSWVLNLVQALTILAVEVVNIIDSPYPVSRAEFVRYIFILPIVSFFVFMFLPSGKKLFVITTLWFSFSFISLNILTRWFTSMFDRMDQAAAKRISGD